MTALSIQTKPFFDQGIITCEIRTLNHRYLDIQFKSSVIFSDLEPIIRNRLSHTLKRGRIDIKFHYQPNANSEEKQILNEPLIQQLFRYCQRINEIGKQNEVPNALQILSWPNVVKSTYQTLDQTLTRDFLLNTFENTLKNLVENRAEEGKKIHVILIDYLIQLEQQVKIIELALPKIRKNAQERILRYCKEAELKIDSQRFEQELVFFLHKIDVSEEVDRLKIHIEECQKYLKQVRVSGTRLDFIMQEINREANTLAAKTNDAHLSLIIVEIKVLIESLREQIQNLE